MGTPSGDLYKVCTRAVINEKEQRICVVLNPVGKTLEKKKALYSQLGMKSKDYSSMVDQSWLLGQNLKILMEEKTNETGRN